MKKTLILFILFNFSFNNSLLAKDTTCKTFDVGCKVNKFMSDTKKFQKQGLEESKDQLKNTAEKALEINEKMKKKMQKK